MSRDASIEELMGQRKTAHVRYARIMMTVLSMVITVLAAARAERPAIGGEGSQPPVRMTRATVLTPAEGPPLLLYAAVNQTDRALDVFTVMAFVFRPDGTLKARQVAPGRRNLDPHETK